MLSAVILSACRLLWRTGAADAGRTERPSAPKKARKPLILPERTIADEWARVLGRDEAGAGPAGGRARRGTACVAFKTVFPTSISPDRARPRMREHGDLCKQTTSEYEPYEAVRRCPAATWAGRRSRTRTCLPGHPFTALG